MGCSPSKGKLFSKPEGPVPQSALPAEPPQQQADCRPVEVENKCLKTEEEKENELSLLTEEHHTKETAWIQLASDTKTIQNSENIREPEVNVVLQEIVSDVVQTHKIKKTEKRKKSKGKKRSIDRQGKSSIVQTKVDFPPHMVRAHQAAYTFLTPNISKYETLLGLLDQAAQTQLSLQPMMSALVLRFEEINQALEEMAEEGGMMLKEHGDYMALPSGMMGLDVMSAKPSKDTANPPDPHPDLLLQLLQHSTEKMRLVGSLVQTVGDTTLEEAVEYYSSLSKLLGEKLQAKQTAERRLAEVLARVEGAALRKSNPEDSALHSEDSGIGGENESLTGSERHRRHRGSAGSGSCGSGGNIRATYDNLPSNLSNLVGHHEDDEVDEEEEEDDEEEYEDDESDRPGRKRSNSSPPDPSQAIRYMHASYIQDHQPTGKPTLNAVTTIKPEAVTCVNVMMDLQKGVRDLDQRMKKMADIRVSHYNFYSAGLRRHSLNGSVVSEKGPSKTYQSPFSLPQLAPQPPKRHFVRRLVNTFSQGVDGRPGQSLANIPPHIKRPKKNGILLLSEAVNGNDNNGNSWPDGRDDLDMDNLPPPPPEVLMDNSFQGVDGRPRNEEEDSVRNLSMINQQSGISQRLKASMKNVEVLPNRTSLRARSIIIPPVRPVRQDAVMGVQGAEQQPDTDLDPEIEKANCLYQQARKIIHLHNAAESPDKRNIVEPSSRGPSPLPARMGQRCESNEFYDGEMSSCNPPVTAPPVSRVRLPPSCPSVRHRFPSPPVFRPHSTSRPPSRPSSPRTVTRATDNNVEEIIPSVSFRDARSVFCQNESQNSQACLSSGSAVLPRRWGEGARGRLPTRGESSSTRRTQSEQRPSELSKELLATKYESGSPPVTGDNDQLDPSVIVKTA